MRFDRQRLLELLVLVVGTLCSRRAGAVGWKDGCPPFAPASAHAFGVAAQSDTAFAPTHTAIDARAVHVTNTETGHTNGARLASRLEVMWATDANIAKRIPGESTHGIVAYAAMTHALTDGADGRAGNVIAAVGYRNARFVLADAMRLGFAARVGAGLALFERAESRRPNELAADIPFEMTGFGFDRPITGSFEWRAELAGCHAPFVHLRIDLTAWRPTVGNGRRTEQGAVFAVPLTLAVGGFVRPRFGFAASIAFQFVTPTRDIFPSHVTRFELLGHVRITPRWSAELYLGGLSGSLTGAEAGVRLGVARWR